VTDWTVLGPPDGARALITARCARCYRVAAKYWEHGNDGSWFTPSTLTFPANATFDDILDYPAVRDVVATRVCRCYPPPTLPTGDELAALVDRARANLQHSNNIHDRRHRPEAGWAPVTIRV
jgi:hypothetical protein